MGKKNKPGVGQTLVKARNRGTRGSHDTWRHTSELNDTQDWKRLNISSITEQSALDDFLATAELAGTEFTAEKLNVTVVTPSRNEGILSAEDELHIQEAQQKNKTLLRIPRRPPWTTSMSAEELDQKERDSFIEWRRQLARLQEEDHIILTPFEKNIEFWRQLWRVIERSDVIVQIVDARNPLLFRCEDLEAYVKEVNPIKQNLLLVNKADYFTPVQRSVWAKHFKEHGIAVAFWSALDETDRLQKEKENTNQAETNSQDVQQDNNNKNENNSVGDDNGDNNDDESDNDVDDNTDDSPINITSRFANLSTADEHSCDNAESTQLQELEKQSEREQENLSLDNLDKNTSKDSSDKDNGQTEINVEKQRDGQTDGCEISIEKQTDGQTDGHEINIEKHAGGQTDKLDTDRQINQNQANQSENRSKKQTDQHENQAYQSDTQSGRQTDTTNEEKASIWNVLDGSGKLLSSDELIQLCQYLHHNASQDDSFTTIGMVGYPNVGKSSTINAILQHKKVSVSATPGRTKHFQTLILGQDVCLCDCPGLVFPSFVSTKAEMVVNGILPIDQMRDHLPPVSLVCQRIPREVLEAVYGINIAKPEEGQDPKRPPLADELLNAYGYMRGYMTSHGTPDCPRSSRYILKDYVMGKLLYCTPPPGVNTAQFQDGRFATGRFEHLEDALEKRRIEAEKQQPTKSSVDEDFFAKKEVRHFVKGTPVMVPGQPGQMIREGMVYKPWKKHNNKNKREKLRRLEKK